MLNLSSFKLCFLSKLEKVQKSSFTRKLKNIFSFQNENYFFLEIKQDDFILKLESRKAKYFLLINRVCKSFREKKKNIKFVHSKKRICGSPKVDL